MTETDNALQTGRDLLAAWTASTATPEPNRLDVALAEGGLLPAVTALVAAGWGYLSAITGLDEGPEAGQMEVLYHFCRGAAVLTLRVRVPRPAASVPSVCGLIPSATLFERELYEMLGVVATDTPNPARLFLPDDWPVGVYPLRKDFAAEM